MRVGRQQVSRGDDHAWNAEAALNGAGFDERLLHRIELSVSAQSFDRDDILAIAFDGEHETSVDRTAVQQHRAGAALAFGAAFFRAGQIQLVAQRLEQRVMRLHIERSGCAVDGERHRHA